MWYILYTALERELLEKNGYYALGILLQFYEKPF